SSKFVYVANFNSEDIAIFSVDAITGALTPAGRVATPDAPTSITIDSRGKFAYVTNVISNVSVFAIDSTTGALTPASTAPTGTLPNALTFDPSGRFAYVANLGSDNVTAFTVDPNTGALTSTGPAVSAGTGPAWVVVQ